MGTPVKVQQVQQIWSLKVKKVGIKRVGFSGIAALAALSGRPDERILVGQSSNNAGHYHPRLELGNTSRDVSMEAGTAGI